MKEISEGLRIIAFPLFTAYLLGIVSRYGVLNSISSSQYFLRKDYKWAFRLLMFLCGSTIVVTGLDLENLFFIIGGGLIFCVGLFATYKRSKIVNILHVSCALGGFAMVVIGFYSYLILLIPTLLIIGYTAWVNSRHSIYVHIWNLEVVTSYLIFIDLQLIYYIQNY
jgi:hypothetical protein